MEEVLGPDRAGISANTANTQLKQIFAKTETNRQAELMRQVLSDSIASLIKPDSTGNPQALLPYGFDPRR